MIPLRPVLRLAWADLRHEWTVSLAMCLAITAVAAPLLVLIGLYEGVVGGIFADLRQDPAARTIRLQASGAARFDQAWFEAARAWPEVAFAVPSTRWAAAQGQVFGPEDARESRASLVPTAPDDPVFDAGSPPLQSPQQVKLSQALAEAVGAEMGSTVTLEISRTRPGGTGETRVVTLSVVDIARPARFERRALFVTGAFLNQVEDFKDGFAAPVLSADGPAPPERSHFRDFRLYARDISDVSPLLARLRAEPFRLTVTGATGRIDFATGLDRSFQLVIWAIGGLSVMGLAGGLAAIQWGMVARRRRIIAVLSLIGFSRATLVAFPVAQAVILGLGGAALTIAAALTFATVINAGLGTRLGLGDGARACIISFWAATGMAALIVVISALPATVIGRRFAMLEPADEVRET
ncbi:MAG: ABC transporter permease [Pseudomonadota bacterium]